MFLTIIIVLLRFLFRRGDRHKRFGELGLAMAGEEGNVPLAEWLIAGRGFAGKDGGNKDEIPFNQSHIGWAGGCFARWKEKQKQSSLSLGSRLS